MMRKNLCWEEELELTSRMIGFINRAKPKFVVVCGDLVNAWPTEAKEIRNRQQEDFKEVVELPKEK